jgi:hypothetical protein
VKNHIYLHTSNLDFSKAFNNEELFQRPYEYDCFDIQKHHQNEFGRIITKDNYYHILLGKIRQKGCAWCECDLEIKQIHVPDFFPHEHNKFCFYCECPRCKCKGPETILYINDQSKEFMEHIHALILDKYDSRIPWDKSASIRKMESMK